MPVTADDNIFFTRVRRYRDSNDMRRPECAAALQGMLVRHLRTCPDRLVEYDFEREFFQAVNNTALAMRLVSDFTAVRNAHAQFLDNVTASAMRVLAEEAEDDNYLPMIISYLSSNVDTTLVNRNFMHALRVACEGTDLYARAMQAMQGRGMVLSDDGVEGLTEELEALVYEGSIEEAVNEAIDWLFYHPHMLASGEFMETLTEVFPESSHAEQGREARIAHIIVSVETACRQNSMVSPIIAVRNGFRLQGQLYPNLVAARAAQARLQADLDMRHRLEPEEDNEEAQEENARRAARTRSQRLDAYEFVVQEDMIDQYPPGRLVTINTGSERLSFRVLSGAEQHDGTFRIRGAIEARQPIEEEIPHGELRVADNGNLQVHTGDNNWQSIRDTPDLAWGLLKLVRLAGLDNIAEVSVRMADGSQKSYTMRELLARAIPKQVSAKEKHSILKSAGQHFEQKRVAAAERKEWEARVGQHCVIRLREEIKDTQISGKLRGEEIICKVTESLRLTPVWDYPEYEVNKDFLFNWRDVEFVRVVTPAELAEEKRKRRQPRRKVRLEE